MSVFELSCFFSNEGAMTLAPLARMAAPNAQTDGTQVLIPPASMPALQVLRQRTRLLPGQAGNFYFDAYFQSAAVKVLPGEYFVSGDDLLLTTVLGSCISACLWEPRLRVGGMNHFLLPGSGLLDGAGRYGACAMELLINGMLELGARREHLQAKIFGGAQVVRGTSALKVGERNTEFVRHYLRTERIALVSEDVLDICPRKVCFFLASGKVMVKRLAYA